MTKRLIVLISLSICIFGCKKDRPSITTAPDVGSLKISLVSGKDQSAFTGVDLKDSVAVKVSTDGSPAKNIIVEFRVSGCNNEFIVQKQTNADGISKYMWQMAADEGEQRLSAVVINKGKRIDSITVTATALKNPINNVTSACTPPNALPLDIRQLSTGRLLACFSGQNAIRYSDNIVVTIKRPWV
ncbi:hypothetical protein [Mucilaginibacter sp.]|uniref:hypothetical protein n=1 Tax=Mucilaginibacter sp. TaxID=1882438 RepID=UPI0026132400|nr:hypothetical protein [Mucilaginibacter sp.]MDB5128854.1 exo-alpha-sialidase [Mucilaginibacter sp.]